MTLNGVINVILRHSIEFDSLSGNSKTVRDIGDTGGKFQD